MTKKAKILVPQSEDEWMQTGKFEVGTVTLCDTAIKYALVRGEMPGPLVIMIGGIPRETDRQQNLPLINKLYGHMALILQKQGISSLLYNQPATGGSGGKWEEETLLSRSNVLSELATHFSKVVSATTTMLVGSSAGAYMAVTSADDLPDGMISKLILLSPCISSRN